MSLETYRQKRDFSRSGEPHGDRGPGESGHRYLIQKHAARRLHYDFRLQVGGVLKSWAVPKGPSLNPGDKRLAVETEDHPLDYGDFEGVIPPDNYGAGTVMLWDKGQWEAPNDVDQALHEGKLSFVLHGERLNGRWALVKMKGNRKSGKEWLLIKEDDEYAAPDTDPTEEYTWSVVTRRSMDAIAHDEDLPEMRAQEKSRRTTGKARKESDSDSRNRRSSKSSAAGKRSKRIDEVDETLEKIQDREGSKQIARGAALSEDIHKLPHAKKAPFPDSFQPQLATLYQQVPRGDEWLHEVKYDGYRLLAMTNHELRLMTRNGKDWTAKFPSIAKAMEQLPQSIIDGELVCLDENGISNFEDLQTILQKKDTRRLVFYAFDLPYLEGRDLRNVPLLERKKLLAAIVQAADNDKILFSGHIEGAGPEVFQHACEHHLEGIISKHAKSPYSNSRTKTWRKVKCTRRQELIIVGYTPPKGSRIGFGSLLLGYYSDKVLKYAGKVGTGFDHRQLRDMHQQLRKISLKASPVDDNVKEAEVTWVKPQLVAEVEFTEWTAGGRLRHPAFVGLREDKSASEVVREVPAEERKTGQECGRTTHAPVAKKRREPARDSEKIAGVSLTHPDKLLYAQSNISKLKLAEYYTAVAEYMLPYVEGRALTLVRCPQGHRKHCFFQKHVGETFDKSVKTLDIEEKQGTGSYAYIETVSGLVGLVQMGTLEIHAWGSKVDAPDKPDTLVFDLDPDAGVDWSDVKMAAFEVRDFLAELGLQSFLRCSGSKGLHVVIPIVRRHSWEEAKAFCKAIAEHLARKHPDRYVATASKAKRKQKIFIDYLRNDRGATSICNYSTRRRPGAPIAAPVDWQELEHLASAQAYNVGNVMERLGKKPGKKLSKNRVPWRDYHNVRQSLTKAIIKQLADLEH